MGVGELVELSRRFGGDPEWVLAGGGNTSVKVDDLLYIKASGYALASMTPEGLVAMRREELQKIWGKTYPAEVEPREEQALADLMNARHPDHGEKRPSVETLMHEALPFTYVIHTHPALVNGITCGGAGERAAQELFGHEALWIPLVNPGYVLAVTVKRAVEKHKARHGSAPAILLLQNHGLVIAADEPEEVIRLHDHVAGKVREHLSRSPDLSQPETDSRAAAELKADLTAAYAEARGAQEAAATFRVNPEILRVVSDRRAYGLVAGPFSPDHIVYAGPEPPLIPRAADREQQKREIADAFARHRKTFGILPRALAVEGVGFFGVGPSESAAEKALLLFEDALKVSVYAESFGGPRFMEEDQVAFIMSWEVEAYRAAVSGGGP